MLDWLMFMFIALDWAGQQKFPNKDLNSILEHFCFRIRFGFWNNSKRLIKMLWTSYLMFITYRNNFIRFQRNFFYHVRHTPTKTIVYWNICPNILCLNSSKICSHRASILVHLSLIHSLMNSRKSTLKSSNKNVQVENNKPLHFKTSCFQANMHMQSKKKHSIYLHIGKFICFENLV